MVRRHVIRSAVGAVLLAVALTATACSGPDLIDGNGRIIGAPPTSAPSGSATPSNAAKPSPSPTSRSTPSVSPALSLLRQLRTRSTANWDKITDARTGTGFSLPTAVASRTTLQNGIAQRIYENKLTEQSSISVSFFHTASAAAAAALLDLYPAQLSNSVRALGADDAAISERRSGTIGGAKSLSFRLTFTPTTIPQIAPVWLVTSAASGADIVLAQTIVFPPTIEYDYVTPVRSVQQRLVSSLRLSG